MLKKNRPLPSYSDGVAAFYAEKQRASSFAAKVNAATLDDLEFLVKLCYAESSVRAQDYEFAEQVGFSVSAKLRTHLHPVVKPGCKAVIGPNIYTVRHVDTSKTEMFVYLEGGAPFGNA